MSLFRTELRRLTKRRFTRYMTLLGLLVLAAVVVGVFFTNQKIDAGAARPGRASGRPAVPGAGALERAGARRVRAGQGGRHADTTAATRTTAR